MLSLSDLRVRHQAEYAKFARFSGKGGNPGLTKCAKCPAMSIVLRFTCLNLKMSQPKIKI